MNKIIAILLLAFPLSLFAQTKQEPIPVELLIGNNRTNMQLSMNRNISGKLFYNNITTVYADYKNTRSETELVMVNSLVYRFQKNFGVSGGLQYHFVKGFVPNIAFHASYADPTWLLVFTPYFNVLPQRNSETIGIVEYKPVLAQNIRLYTRAQALYNYNLNYKAHDRSFYYFRLGLAVNKIAFGAAANLDYYGQKRIKKENFGGFFKINL